MDKYLRKNSTIATSLGKMSGNSKEKVSLNLHDLPRDPSLQTVISKLDPNIQDEVRRAYLQIGPFQLC